MSRTEPDLPSIQTPLAHENGITTELARTSIDAHNNGVATQLAGQARATSPPTRREPGIPAPVARGTAASETAAGASTRDRALMQLDPDPEISPEPEPGAYRAAHEMLDKPPGRTWPRTRHADIATPEPADDHVERRHNHGWEP